MYSGLNKIN